MERLVAGDFRATSLRHSDGSSAEAAVGIGSAERPALCRLQPLAESATLSGHFSQYRTNDRYLSGGFALIATSALEGAPPALVKNLMPDFKKLPDDKLWDELDLPDNEVDE